MNTGLGWEANGAYLIYAAGTWLGDIGDRSFVKVNNGWAIAVWAIQAGYNSGPMLVSTDQAAAEITPYPYMYSARLYKRTMYFGAGGNLTGEYTTPLPVINQLDLSDVSDRIADLLEVSGFKLHCTDRTRSFLAGFAVGLAQRTWAYMGEVAMRLIQKLITANGTYNAVADGADGYSSVTVQVTPSFVPADEGKVVQDGALVAQTATTVTATGTYTTTTNNQVVVDIPMANGEEF